MSSEDEAGGGAGAELAAGNSSGHAVDVADGEMTHGGLEGPAYVFDDILFLILSLTLLWVHSPSLNSFPSSAPSLIALSLTPGAPTPPPPALALYLFCYPRARDHTPHLPSVPVASSSMSASPALSERSSWESSSDQTSPTWRHGSPSHPQTPCPNYLPQHLSQPHSSRRFQKAPPNPAPCRALPP